MRRYKPTGRYGPQRSCAYCSNHCGDKPYLFMDNISLCSRECLEKWWSAVVRDKIQLEENVESLDREFSHCKETNEELNQEIKEFTRTIHGHYNLIDKVQRQLDLAGVPKGGNILDRLEYLVEAYLTNRKYIPRIAYLLETDND